MGQRASYSVTDMTSTRASLYGLALVGVLLAFLVGLVSGPAPASAATLGTCDTTQPTGPIVDLGGQLALGPVKATRRAWKRAGITQKLIRPASGLTGSPTFPVAKVSYGATAKVRLKGGIRIVHGGRSVTVRNLTVLSARGKPALVRGKVGGKTRPIFKVQGGKRFFNAKRGQFTRTGLARLTAGGARFLNARLKTGAARLDAGTVWGRFNLYALYKVTPVEDPHAEIPEVPPVKVKPDNAYTVETATTVKWFVRDSFINYVAAGEGTRTEDGATGDAPSGPNNLVYSFNFPFASGWTVPNGGEVAENTLVKGSGLVGFRYCQNTINFTVSDPEIELDGDENSRLIFHVNGTDGTAFPDQRAVMVKLIPGNAQSRQVVDNGNGTKTVTFVKIPGYIPSEATGIFAGFYSAFDTAYVTQPQPACGGVPCTEETRPDRFGFFSVTYNYRYDS